MSAASGALAAGLGALTESMRATCNDPADAIRLRYALARLSQLAPIRRNFATERHSEDRG